MKRLALTAPVLLLAACASAAHTTTSTGTPPPPARTKTIVNARGSYFPVIDNDGTYVVDIDIPAGKYRSDGGKMCHWARLHSLDTSDIIDSKKTGDPQVITIRATDTAFLTQNCGSWQMVPAL